MSEAQFNPTLVFASRRGWPVQWIVQIDPVMKRLRLLRRRFGRWTKTLIDCSFDECLSVGVVQYDRTEGNITYGTYFKLKDGYWHAIPTRGTSFAEALEVVDQVSSATGIPRIDFAYNFATGFVVPTLFEHDPEKWTFFRKDHAQRRD